MSTAILSTTYFGPIQWYQKLAAYDCVLIDRHEPFVKQTYRNRCIIATTNGTQALTVPIVHGSSSEDILISDHGNWRHLHWNALVSAYGESPFFEYYADDVRPFFEGRWTSLYDFNMSITRKMCELLDIAPNIIETREQLPVFDGKAELVDDFRQVIRPKHSMPDPSFTPRTYYQVFHQKHGFLPNLSIMDLLFNMGNESILWLI